MHESVDSTLTGEVRSAAGARRWRWLTGLVAALALGGCGDTRPPPEAAPAPAPEVAASTGAGLTCAPSELGGEWSCAGPFTYSLECYGLRTATVCGADTGPRTCTTYNTCEHPDFGRRRGTYTLVAPLSKNAPELDCTMAARDHLATLSATDREGVTYTWYIGTPGTGEESLTAARAGAEDGVGSAETACIISFANYPVGYNAGTGPQCGTSQFQCSPACVNPQTCFINGAWVTGAQCGTLVGPCSAASLSPVYRECRHPDHGLAPDAQCGAGFESAQAPTGSTPEQVRALAASQWAAAKGLGAPVYDAPITCSDCRGTLNLTPVELHRRVYTTAAISKRDAKLHLLAGAAYYLARDNPALTQAELTAGLNAVSTALAAYAFDPAQDGSGPLVRLMIRILGRAEPTLASNTPADRALRAYARAFLGSMRGGLDLQRALTSTHSQVERYAEAEAFIEKSWGQLFDLARGNAALAGAVNDGVIGTTLGVHTTSTARQILAVYTLEPLESFVLSHLTPEGGLTATPAQARALVTGAATQGLAAARAYAGMLKELNTAEQAYRDSVALPRPGTSASATLAGASAAATPEQTLQEAIQQARTRRTQLAGQLNGVREGVHSGLNMAADLFRRNGEARFADDIVKFAGALNTTLESVAKYAESSVKIAEKVSGFLGLGVKGFEVVSAAVFTGQLVGAAFQLFSLLRKDAEPPIEQTILTEVRKLHALVEQIQDQLATRFDRVDRRLNLIHQEMQARFDKVDWELGQVKQNVEETQRALHSLQANLSRLDQNMYEYLLDAKRDPFESAVWTYLGWSTRHPTPMRYQEEFIPAESQFSRWAALEASQSTTLAGIDGRGSNPDISPLGELAGHSLSYNINYLREFPVQLGGSPLHPRRLPSPMDWMAGAESYAQLFEEQPALGALMLSTRHADVAAAGASLDQALRNIDKPLFAALHQRYLADWNGMKALLESADEHWRGDLDRNLHGIDPWGGPDQEPARHSLKLDAPPPGQSPVLRSFMRCRSSAADWYDLDGDGSAELMETDPARWSHPVLRPLLIADNLNVDSGRLELCVLGEWVWFSAEPTGFLDFIEFTFRLQATVQVRYGYRESSTAPWKVETVYSHSRLSRKIETKYTMRESQVPTFDPNAHFEADKSVQRHWGALLNPDPLTDSAWTSGPRADAFRAALRQKVAARLVQEQRDFYDSIADRMAQAGDPLQQRADRLTGTKLLWESYVALALPLSLEHDEGLRALLYGDDAVLAGGDVPSPSDVEVTPVMDDLSDVYRLFSTAATPPDHNILADLHPAATSRADRLKAILDATLDAQTPSGGPESSSWVEATLLRLRLSVPVAP